MSECLTNNLSLEIEKTNIAFNRWSEKQGDWLRTNDSTFEQLMVTNTNYYTSIVIVLTIEHTYPYIHLLVLL